MYAFVFVVAVGAIVGFARGGSLNNVTSARLALLPLVWCAAGLQIAAQFVPPSLSILAYGAVVISYAALFAFAGANWRLSGMLFIALGAAMNYTVILANQGMPISANAAARAGFVGDADQLVLRGKHFVTTTDDARLMFLGDIIPLWRQPAVASVGDLVLWAGLILLVQELMRPRGRMASRRRRGRSFIEVPAAHRVLDLRARPPIDLTEAEARARAELASERLEPDERDEPPGSSFPH